MNKLLLGIVLGVVLGAAATWILFRGGKEEDTEAGAEHEAVSRVQETNGVRVLHLDAETQQRMGLKVEPLPAAQVSPEVKGYGRVLDPAPLTALASEINAAKASLEASSNELARVEMLYKQNQNVSLRSLQTARATAQRDRITLEAARDRLALNWGKNISERTNLLDFARSLVALQDAVVRVDVPAGERLSAEPSRARLYPLGRDEAEFTGRLLGPAANVDPLMQGRGFLFLVETNSGRLYPGQTVMAYLELPGQTNAGVAVPRAAVVRAEGQTWVYEQTGAEVFRRRGIDLEQPLRSGWFVRRGVEPGAKVVVVGAQQLLSEELKSQMKAEEE